MRTPIIIVGAAIAALMAPATGALAATADAAEATRLRQLVAELRTSEGLPPFDRHPELDAKADAWAETMAQQGRIWHSTLSEGITANWRRLGENVGMGGAVEQIHDALVRSPDHYANLTNPEFGHAGFGVAASPRGLFVAQVFMALSPASPPPAPGPAPAPPAPAGGPAPASGPAPAPPAPAPAASTVPARPRSLPAATQPGSGAPRQPLPAPAAGAAVLPPMPVNAEPVTVPSSERPASGAEAASAGRSFSARLASFARDPLPGAGTTPAGWGVGALALAFAGRLAATGHRRLSRSPQPLDAAGTEQHQAIQ